MEPVRVAALVGGAVAVAATVMSAVSTVVVPHGESARLTRTVFAGMRWAFRVRRRWVRAVDRHEPLLARYAPYSLLGLMFAWLTLILAGGTVVFWGVDDSSSLPLAFARSGSSLTTLGNTPLHGTGQHVVAFTEAGLGLFVLALMIGYLPAMYAAFQRRESLVMLAAIQAGTPPTPTELLTRFHLIRGLDDLPEQVWEPWTKGFVDIEESHTSLHALGFFRSPIPGQSWVTAAGAVLDAANFLVSTVDAGRQPSAQLCIRAGYLSLRRVAAVFDIDVPSNPRPDDPISVTRRQWENARVELRAAGIPLREDADQAWRDFAGWRVNYDASLAALARLFEAPASPWT